MYVTQRWFSLQILLVFVAYVIWPSRLHLIFLRLDFFEICKDFIKFSFCLNRKCAAYSCSIYYLKFFYFSGAKGYAPITTTWSLQQFNNLFNSPWSTPQIRRQHSKKYCNLNTYTRIHTYHTIYRCLQAVDRKITHTQTKLN